MTDGYDCYQNALAERIYGILKTELLLSSPENLEQARKMVAEAVQIYNTERPHMAQSLHAKSVAQAFRQALRKRQRRQSLVHHSDRGIQYFSALYQSLHARHGVQCSMTDGYDCYQNALAERIYGILKTELLLSSPENLEQARKMVAEAAVVKKRSGKSSRKVKSQD